jgi:hypothetical protein
MMSWRHPLGFGSAQGSAQGSTHLMLHDAEEEVE